MALRGLTKAGHWSHSWPGRGEFGPPLVCRLQLENSKLLESSKDKLDRLHAMVNQRTRELATVQAAARKSIESIQESQVLTEEGLEW